MSKQLALVINCGSSSLKYGVFEVKGNDCHELCGGLVDKIGLDGCVIKHEQGADSKKIQKPLKDHSEAMRAVLEILTATGGCVSSKADIKVVGHRVVHGGASYSEPTIINAEVLEVCKKCYALAPLHNPPNVMGIELAMKEFPVPNVAVFDTAFHATMPPESYRYAVGKDLYEQNDVRRYGFHGTSYKYVSGRTAELLGHAQEDLNMIICHLGNGCSMACLKNGKVVDTTMGLTPLEGLMMGTRCGDLDCGVYTYLCDALKKTPKEVDTLLNKKSGLLGVAGKSDMREVIEGAKKGDADCALARAMYVQRVRKYVGAFLMKLDGELDALVFTAGVGENDKEFRELVTSGMSRFGVVVDGAKNRSVKEGEIQGASSISKVMVVPTQEEYSIARQSLEVTKVLQPLGGAVAKAKKPAPRTSWPGLAGAKQVATPITPTHLAIGAMILAGLAFLSDRKSQ